MVKSASGKNGYRSFTLINLTKKGGCKTKYHGGRYVSKTPRGAALKAFSEHCRVKRIRGICTLSVVVRETTQGSKHNVFAYKLNRHKLKNPIILQEGTPNEYVIEYKPVAKSIKSIPENCRLPEDNSHNRRGRMKKHTAKKYRMTGNNVRKGRRQGSVKRSEMFRRAESGTGRTRSGKKFRGGW
jgi:hypothetical protein